LISQTELMRLSRTELMVLQRGIAGELVYLSEDSIELRNAHANLVNIRRGAHTVSAGAGATSVAAAAHGRKCTAPSTAVPAASDAARAERAWKGRPRKPEHKVRFRALGTVPSY
jgi:hypothetical protein